MLTIWQAVILGAVQGLTEFLPVSSSAHLALAPWLLGWPDPGLAFDIALHAGTLLAVLAAVGGDLWEMAVAALRRPATMAGRLGWAVALGTLPGVIAGALLAPLAAGALRRPVPIALGLAAFGLVLWWADAAAPAAGASLATPRGAAALLCAGATQALAVVPGVSRSGSTMAAARLAGLSRPDAARAAFLLAVPIVLAATVYSLPRLAGSALTAAFWCSLASAATVGYVAIRSLLRLVGRWGFAPFALYRLALAAAILAAWWLRA